MGKLRHSKKRNTALLYEFLIRHISKCLVDDRKDEAKKAIAISKKYFSKGTCLSKEMQLFNIIADNTFKTRDSAQKVLSEVISISSQIDLKKLDEEKSKLIKEINYTFKDSSFYDYKVPHYSTLASLQMLINESRSKKGSLDLIDRVKIEENLINYLCTEKVRDTMTPLKTDPKYSNAVYKMVWNKFQEKYANTLTENQRKLLTKFVVASINDDKSIIKSAVLKEVAEIKEKLRLIKDESVKKDTDLVRKINECYKKLAASDFSDINHKSILQVLQYMTLVNEINSEQH